MKNHWLPLLLFSGLTLTACDPTIPLLGLDDHGNVVEQNVPGDAFSHTLGETLASVQDSTLPALQSLDSTLSWSVPTVMVGLVINGDAGVGAYRIYGMGRFRLAFSNNLDPALP